MLVDIVQALTAWVENIVTGLGAPGITLIAFLENMFPPTPSEILYPLAGKLAYDGRITILTIVVAGVIGSLIGATVYYTLGYYLGEERARLAVGRYGRLTLWRLNLHFVSVEEYDRALALFKRRGGAIVLIARLMPLVHGVVSIPAGVARMPFLPFMLYTAVGSALWIAPLSLLGYWLGSEWERVLDIMNVYENLWYVGIALLVVWYIYRRWRKRQTVPVEAGD